MNIIDVGYVYHLIKNDLIFETKNTIQDELLGYLEISNFLLIQEKEIFGPFINYFKRNNIIEFETLNNNFLQLDIENSSWRTVSFEKSLIIKRDRHLDKIDLSKQQILFCHYSKQTGIT